jgi:hypothetical protein
MQSNQYFFQNIRYAFKKKQSISAAPRAAAPAIPSSVA